MGATGPLCLVTGADTASVPKLPRFSRFFVPNFFSFPMTHGHPITRLVYPYFPLGFQADTIKEAAGHSSKTRVGGESVTQRTSRGILLDGDILWRMPDQRSWLSLNKMAYIIHLVLCGGWGTKRIQMRKKRFCLPFKVLSCQFYT